MKKILTTCLIGASALSCAAACGAQERGTDAEAEDMVKRAIVLIQRDGAAKAYKTFNDAEGKAFKDRDLFVFVYDFQGTVLASSGNARMVGKNLIDMRDADGQQIVRGVIDMVKKSRKGWYGPYKFSNPQTQEYERKKTYCEQAVGETMVCSGVYLGR